MIHIKHNVYTHTPMIIKPYTTLTIQVQIMRETSCSHICNFHTRLSLLYDIYFSYEHSDWLSIFLRVQRKPKYFLFLSGLSLHSETVIVLKVCLWRLHMAKYDIQIMLSLKTMLKEAYLRLLTNCPLCDIIWTITQTWTLLYNAYIPIETYPTMLTNKLLTSWNEQL